MLTDHYGGQLFSMELFVDKTIYILTKWRFWSIILVTTFFEGRADNDKTGKIQATRC